MRGPVVSERTGQTDGVYVERPSTIRGAVVWSSTSRGGTGRILPDGCIDVIVTEDRAVVAGPDRVSRWHTGVAGERSVAIRFAPGQAPSIVGIPAAELVGTTVPLAALLGDAATRRLLERMAASPDPGAELETAFLVAAQATSDPRRDAVVAALDRGDSVDAAADLVGWGPRQLHRRSQDWFGYGPKHLAKVLRFQRALRAIRAGRPLAATAAELGYVDQSHLARDARGLAGATLTELAGREPASPETASREPASREQTGPETAGREPAGGDQAASGA